MTLDPQLLFKAHIDALVDKTTNKLGLLYKTRWLFDKQTALALYKSLITPLLDYGSILYEIAPQYAGLQIIQNAAARLIMTADARCPIYQLHEDLHLDTLATRRCKSMVKVTFNCLHDRMPLHLSEKLKPVQHGGRVTRGTEAGMLEIPRVRGKYGQYAYGHRGPLQWNLTSPIFKAAANKVQLKNLLKTSWYNAK